MEKEERKSKSYYESPEGANYLTYLYRDFGMTDEEVAKKIGYSRRTLYNWKNSSRIIETAINVGKSYVDTNVENALLKAALSGNVTAQIFWLKNRKKDKWSDVYQQEVTSSVDIKKSAEKYRKYLLEGEEDGIESDNHDT